MPLYLLASVPIGVKVVVAEISALRLAFKDVAPSFTTCEKLFKSVALLIVTAEPSLR